MFFYSLDESVRLIKFGEFLSTNGLGGGGGKS